jgi:hypothetical protein
MKVREGNEAGEDACAPRTNQYKDDEL